jgi:hypothetical protein
VDLHLWRRARDGRLHISGRFGHRLPRLKSLCAHV